MSGLKRETLTKCNTSRKNGRDLVNPRECKDCKVTFPIGEFLIGKRPQIRRYCRKCNAARQSAIDKTPKIRFIHAKSLAKKSGRAWTLGFDEWFALVQLPCDYCGAKLHEHGRGVDRVDNSDCYRPGNCVPCCALCNQGKAGTYTHEEYKEIGALNRKFRERRAANGEPPLETWISYRKGKKLV